MGGNGGGTVDGNDKGTDSLEGHGFEWRNGYIYCTVCDSFLKRPVDLGRKLLLKWPLDVKSFATANEPGGLKYNSTKVDTDFNEAARTVTVGNGELLPR